MKKLAVIIPAIAFGCLAASAQTTPADSIMNRTVVVEQQYNPDIVDAQKINAVPKVTEITVSPKAVEYDNNMMPAKTIPAGIMNPYTAEETQNDAYKGYVRFGYGIQGNLDIRANYLMTPTTADKLNVLFDMGGRSGKLHKVGEEGKWKSHYYRTQAAANYVHQFKKLDMDIAADVSLSNFNNSPQYPSSDKQKRFTAGAGHIGFASTSDELPVQFTAETNLMLYSRAHPEISASALKETLVRTKANITGSIAEEQTIGLALTMNNRFLNGYKDYKDYTTLLLNPYYVLGSDNWKLHLGLNVDVAMSYGDKFNLSPDVTASYTFAQSYVLYAQATGGRIMNDFRRLEIYNPHAALPQFQVNDSYERINAMLGLKASPATGLWFNIYGGYQDIKDDLLAVSDRIIGLPETLLHIYYHTNTNNVYGGANVSYNYKDAFRMNLNAKYQHWDDNPLMQHMLKPEMTLEAQAAFSPTNGLNIHLAYQYIQRTKPDSGKRPDAVNNLTAGFDYQLLKGVSIYARAHNILNSKYSYYLGYMDQGISVLGGLSFRF